MFRVGQEVFESQFGWGKIKHINIEPSDPCPIFVEFKDSTNFYSLDGMCTDSDLFPSLFESPEALVDYFQKNASPKPKVKVKRTIEGWINYYPAEGYCFHENEEKAFDIFSGVGKPGELRAIPATLTYEIEE